MNETDKNDLLENEETNENEATGEKEFVLEETALNTVSSASVIKNEAEIETPEVIAARAKAAEAVEMETAEIAADSEKEVDPIFATLAAPQLPRLGKENRARLQMQSPNRLYFYWSLKNNPYHTLQKVFGGNSGNYQLVAKLLNQTTEREEMYAIEAEGDWWFNVEANSDYRAEIGFYAPNRPFIRVLFSNAVETPRKAPSPRAASESDWAISAREFAEVLDHSGFTRDAFEVALTGDDQERSDAATKNAFQQLIGEPEIDFAFSAEEIRFALLSLAAGATLDSLRGQISEALFIYLQEHTAKLSVENALSALQEHFEVFDEEIFEEEETGALVYGASLVNFPKTVKKRATTKTRTTKSVPGFAPKLLPKLAPLSSFSIGKS